MQAHIVRIDSEHTHAWQVRYSLPEDETGRYRSKTFSDNVHGGKRKSGALAREFLASVLKQVGAENLKPGRRRGMKYPESPGRVLRHNQSGRNGVYRSEFFVQRPHGIQMVRYWAASYSIGPDGKKTNRSRRFYIGERSEEQARSLATEFRERWEKAFLADGTRGVRRFFKEWEKRKEDQPSS